MTDSRAGKKTHTRGGIVLRTITANAVGPASTFLTAYFLAHGMGPAGRGELAAATMPLSLAAAALALGIPEASVFYLARKLISPIRVFRISIGWLTVAGLIGSALIVMLAPYLAGNNKTIENLIRISAFFVVPSTIIWAMRGWAQGVDKWHRVNSEKVLTGFSRLVAILFLLARDELTLVNAFLVYMLAPLVGYFSYLPTGRFKREGSSRSEIQPKFLSFALRVWMGSMAGILLSRLDQVLMITLSSDHELGLYSTAATVADIPLVVTGALASVLLTWEGKTPSAERGAKVSRVTLGVVGGGALLSSATAIWWFPAVFGSDFEPGTAALIVLVLSMAAGAPGSIAGSIMTARGHPAARSRSIVIALIVNVILLIALAPVLGALGASLATAAGQACATVLSLLQLRRLCGVHMGDMVLVSWNDMIWALGKVRGRSKTQRGSERPTIGPRHMRQPF